MNCNEVIKKLRVQNYYSQQEVADILGISQRAYADYEYGNTRISTNVLIELARYYNVDLNYISGVSNVINTFPTE